MMLGSIAVYHLMVYFMISVTGRPIKAQALSGDLINANFAFKYLYRHKQKFANKRLCIYTE